MEGFGNHVQEKNSTSPRLSFLILNLEIRTPSSHSVLNVSHVWLPILSQCVLTLWPPCTTAHLTSFIPRSLCFCLSHTSPGPTWAASPSSVGSPRQQFGSVFCPFSHFVFHLGQFLLKKEVILLFAKCLMTFLSLISCMTEFFLDS